MIFAQKLHCGPQQLCISLAISAGIIEQDGQIEMEIGNWNMKRETEHEIGNGRQYARFYDNVDGRN